MEDILYFILVAAVMIGGAVSSANKKKKARDAAARKAAQDVSGENPGPERKFVRKSLSEILEELADQSKQAHEAAAEAAEIAEEQEDYYTYETASLEESERAYDMASLEESERAAERLRAMTYVSAENTPRRIAAEPEPAFMQIEAADADSQGALKDILGEGGFDLRRAVIETEILKPKFEQY